MSGSDFDRKAHPAAGGQHKSLLPGRPSPAVDFDPQPSSPTAPWQQLESRPLSALQLKRAPGATTDGAAAAGSAPASGVARPAGAASAGAAAVAAAVAGVGPAVAHGGPAGAAGTGPAVAAHAAAGAGPAAVHGGPARAAGAGTAATAPAVAGIVQNVPAGVARAGVIAAAQGEGRLGEPGAGRSTDPSGHDAAKKSDADPKSDVTAATLNPNILKQHTGRDEKTLAASKTSSQKDPTSTMYPMSGVLNGVVIALDDKDGKQPRVKVKFPELAQNEARDPSNVVSDWAWLVMPGAGKERGFTLLPEKDDQVQVAFEQGDINRPYVLGGLWNEKDAPPNEEQQPTQGKRIRGLKRTGQLTSGNTGGEEKIQNADQDPDRAKGQSDLVEIKKTLQSHPDKDHKSNSR